MTDSEKIRKIRDDLSDAQLVLLSQTNRIYGLITKLHELEIKARTPKEIEMYDAEGWLEPLVDADLEGE